METHTHSTTKTCQTLARVRSTKGPAYPDVSKGRIQRLLAVHIKGLRNNSDDGHEDAEKAVLEDTDPDNLNEYNQLQHTTKDRPGSLH